MKVVDLKKLKSVVGHSPYSWHQLYRKSGLGRSTYRYWNGEREMPLEIALTLAFYLSVPARDFLTNDGLFLIRQAGIQ